MSNKTIANTIIQLFKDNPPQTFDTIKKKQLDESAILLCFEFDDCHKYEVIIMDKNIREALYYDDNNGVKSKTNLSTPEEAVDFLFMCHN